MGMLWKMPSIRKLSTISIDKQPITYYQNNFWIHFHHLFTSSEVISCLLNGYLQEYVTTNRAQSEGPLLMMTSLNENIFRVTGPLCGRFTGHRWIPLTKSIDADLWLICVWINNWIHNRRAGDLRGHCNAIYGVIVVLIWINFSDIEM